MELAAFTSCGRMADLPSAEGGVTARKVRRNGVLVVLPASEQPTSAPLDRLAHEYALKDELDSAWAVRPLELLRDRGRTVLVLEDPGGVLLSGLLNQPMEVGRFLRLAVGVAAAVGKAHQRGLIHKDIKPANILVDQPARRGAAHGLRDSVAPAARTAGA